MVELWLAYGPYLCGALALMVVWSLFFSWRCSRRLQLLLRLQQQLDQTDEPGAAARFAAVNRELQSIRKFLEELAQRQEETARELRRCVRTPVLKRYNAFPDVGGELSFSATLLDGEGSGFILTGLYGRRETRVYAKEIKGGAARARLAQEEEEVLASSSQRGD
ncbi:DUF4446 family protein [Desulfothermobacter acidiphilus]|uniref:DUF4446 family protein n=1 Tax=Desulfothermobacter acidiphilus TaxID=1938353 RepID=UPI003F88D5CC